MCSPYGVQHFLALNQRPSHGGFFDAVQVVYECFVMTVSGNVMQVLRDEGLTRPGSLMEARRGIGSN